MNHRERLSQNPFYVLELRPDTSRMEIERQGKKLLGMLELGLAGAKTYKTPAGECERTPDMVRTAMSELQDPKRRLVHELWAQLEPDATVELGDINTNAEDHERLSAPWSGALKALGWSR